MLQVLRGNGPADTAFLSIQLAAEMIKLANPNRRLDDIVTELEEWLQNGTAFEKFKELTIAQGANSDWFDRLAVELTPDADL